MKHTLDQAESFSFADVVAKAYNTQSDTYSVSYLKVSGAGRAPEPSDLQYEFVFYVESGSGQFTVGDSEINVSATDLVTVPKGIAFHYSGQMTLIEFMSPAYKE